MTVGLSARAQESALVCPSKRIDLQKWDLQQKGHVHTAEYVPVEENLYSYSKTYRNGTLSLAQSPVSSSPCEPVSENQTREDFYCVGKAKWKKDWYFSPWLMSQHTCLLSVKARGNSCSAGFWSNLLHILLVFGSGVCLVSVQCLLQVCTPELCSLLTVYKEKRENIQVLTLSRFPDQNQWERRGERTLLKY